MLPTGAAPHHHWCHSDIRDCCSLRLNKDVRVSYERRISTAAAAVQGVPKTESQFTISSFSEGRLRAVARCRHIAERLVCFCLRKIERRLASLCKLTWLVLGEDQAARSHRVKQLTALMSSLAHFFFVSFLTYCRKRNCVVDDSVWAT